MQRALQTLPGLLLALACATAAAQSAPVVATALQPLRVNTVLRGLEHPWSMAFLPDGRLLVTERAGRLRLVDKDFGLDPVPVQGLPDVVARGQGGLLDVVLHPQYARNGWIYWAYNEPGEGGWGTALARGKLQGQRMVQVQRLFAMQPKTRTGHHFGGRIVFDKAGMLYLTLGDRGEKDRAQNLADHAGSVIRLHDDGRVPSDNPFVRTPGAQPEKWTLGNRNMQGAALHPDTGALWTHEHGPQGGDEVNVMRAAGNYGWPLVSFGVNYGSGTPIGQGQSLPGLVPPVHVWVPSIAPSGMAFVVDSRYPRWQGNLLVGALRDQMLVRLELDGERVLNEERMLQNQLGRIRDVRMGPDGFIYVLIDEDQGALVRLEPVAP